jgi:hypothetical protein
MTAPTNPTAATHKGGALLCHTAQVTVDIGSSTQHKTCAAQALACHNGDHSSPAKAKGVTTQVTQGMANKLAKKPTNETC